MMNYRPSAYETEFITRFDYLFHEYGFEIVWRDHAPIGIWGFGLESIRYKARIEVIAGIRGEVDGIGPLAAQFELSDCFDHELPWKNLRGVVNEVRKRHGLEAVWGKWGVYLGDLPTLMKPFVAEVLAAIKEI